MTRSNPDRRRPIASAHRDRHFQNSGSRLCWLSICVALLTNCGCSDDSVRPPASDTPPAKSAVPKQIVVTSEPWRSVVAQLVGDAATVQSLTPERTPAANPRPDSAAIALLQSADLVIVNGANREPWLKQITVARSRLLVLADCVKDDLLRAESVTAHQHGPDGSISSGAVLWATWLDPRLAIQQISTIEQRLLRLHPDQADRLAARSRSLRDELQNTADQVDALKTQFPDVAVVCHQPNFDYLWQALNWKKLKPGAANVTSATARFADSKILAIETADPADKRSEATEELKKDLPSAVPLTLSLCETADQSLSACLQHNVQQLSSALASQDRPE